MTVTNDPVALNEWIICGWIGQMPPGESLETMILGQPITVMRTGDTGYRVAERLADGRAGRELPVQLRFGSIFTTLGTPQRPLPEMPEFDEPDRVHVNCGAIRTNTSPYRIIENFLDMAHFSFIHPGILGTVEETEVQSYRTEHRKDPDEIWAIDCPYMQPKGLYSPSRGEAPPGIGLTTRTYRIMSPFSACLAKVSPRDPSRLDITSIFVQPLTETSCLVHTPVTYLGDPSVGPGRAAFQQTIFMQDRIVLENQIPALFPLDPTAELPTRADATSIAYRRWLKGMGIRFAIFERREAA